MKKLKNADKTICGIEYYPFVILIMPKKGIYEYYLINRIPIINKAIRHQRIWKGDKVVILNKVTLTILWVLYSLGAIAASIICTTLYPFIAYAEGGKNFITDSVWVTNVRYFGWVNLGLIFSLITALIVK